MDEQTNPASRQELMELREEVRRLREEHELQKQHPANGDRGPQTSDNSHSAHRVEAERHEQNAEHDHEEQQNPGRFRRNRKPLMIAGVILLVLIGLGWWLYARQFENTDDAIVDAHISGVASRISGTVVAVYVDQNQPVKAGQVLADLDPRDYQVAVEQARAQWMQAQGQTKAEQPNVPVTQTTNQAEIAIAGSSVASAQAGVTAAERNYQAALERVRESEANNAKAQADVDRYRPLAAKDEVSQEQFAQVVASAKALAATVSANQEAAKAAEKQIEQAREQLAQAENRASQTSKNAPLQVAIRRANLTARLANVEAAQAQLDQAQLNLSYCKIVAAVDGMVAKRIAEIGQHISPGQQLFLLTQTSDMWVTANFRETQLRHMQAGQSVRIHVDAIDRDFDGYLESMPAASGAVTSLLPPENATGNFVKVVQRLPARIRFKPGQEGLNLLRPGMSVEPKVRVR